jgi:DNA repair protein RadA
MTEADAPAEEFNNKQAEMEANKKKYEFIEDLPGVGPATAAKLRELGYHTVESLAMATYRELDPVGVSEKKAFQIIEAARSSIGIAFIRADELYKMRKNVARITTGSKALDKIVDGGLETQTITEFYGEYGCGKSQMCHQLCVNVQLPIERGGLNGAALYVDTENTFRLERIAQMAKFAGLDPNKWLKTSFTLKPTPATIKCFS